MRHHILAKIKSFVYQCYIRTPLRRLGARIIPAGQAKAYTFEDAKTYWHNIPRSQGASPFNSRTLLQMPEEELVKEFDLEAEDARRNKRERQVGFARAKETLQAIDSPNVMDYGSGIGFYGFEVLRQHPGARVTFVDINEANLMAISRIARVKKLSDRVSTMVVQDPQANDLAFEQHFDMIISMGVLHHTPHAPQIVRKLTQYLKTGGIFQVMLYNYEYMGFLQECTGRKLNESRFGALTDPSVNGLSNPYSEPYDDAKAKELFSGYELISADYPTPYYNTYRFKKI